MKNQLSLLLITLFIFSSLAMWAQETEKQENKLKFSSDFSFRVEMDRSSDRTDGTQRDDRDRMRYRYRLGSTYKVDDNFSFGARVRSGNPLNQQSPHVTLGKEFHSDFFALDKAYVKAKSNGGIWAWAGKNSMPFWTQNEMLWDGDVNPEGIALGTSLDIGGDAQLVPTVGYFIENHAGTGFGDDSRLTTLQFKYTNPIGDNKLVFSSGLILGSDLPDRPDGSQSFLLDYNIWATSFGFNLKNSGLTFEVDYYMNLNDYDGSDDIPEVFQDQKTGYVAGVKYNKNKIQLRYYFAHIERLAVIDYFAQDDWVRWGNSNYTRSSNLQGHEFRFTYKINSKVNTVFRTYIVEGIETTGTSVESGTRARLDFNIKI